MKKFSMIKKRIRHFAEQQGISIREIYKKANITDGTLSNSSGLNEENLLKFLSNYSDVHPEWLILGKGEPLYTQRKKSKETTEATAYPSIDGIPLILSKAFAGYGGGEVSIAERDIQDRYVIPDFTNVDFMIRIKGSSMYPKYASGDVVACRLINNSKFIQWNKVHVISTREQGVLIKRLKKCNGTACLLAVSDNDKYDPFEIPTDEILNIAIVVGVVRLE